MTTITEFLLARIAEDEVVARAPFDINDIRGDKYFAAMDLRDRQPHEQRCAWRLGEGLSKECECGYPTRVLAECEAKRRIVELHERGPHPLNRKANPFTGEPEEPTFVCEECSGDDDPYVDQVDYPCATAKILASVYADHPDYREEWR